MNKGVFGLLVLLVAAFINSGCSGGDSDDSINFHETFDAYNASNYTSAGSNTWGTVSDSGNMVIRESGDTGHLIYNNISSGNYKVSARIKLDNVTTPFSGIIAYFNNDGTHNNFYCLTIEGSPSYLVLRKFFEGAGYNPPTGCYENFVALNSSTWYTLTLEINGTQITGSVTDGVNTANVSWNEDGSFHGAVLPHGDKAGLYGDPGGGSTYTYFDDLIITGI